MARACYICGKQTTTGNNRSHSKRATRRTFDANLHTKKFPIQGQKLKLKVCTTCLRTINKSQVKTKDIKALEIEV